MAEMTKTLQPVLHITGCYGNTVTVDGVTVCGQVWLGDSVLAPSQLKAAIVAADVAGQLPEFLASLNGFFSVLCQLETQLLCFSDKVRSRPLYYTLVKQQIIISDSAELICSQYLPHAGISALTQQEFEHTGFVTGKDTLHPAVKQLQAAELLQVNLDTMHLCTELYYCFIPYNNVEPNTDIVGWQRKLDAVVSKVVNRLIRYAAGRQIVVPLSGGYDSRALALYLKQAGYTNVLCFTFGRPGSAEVELSKRVAAELGFAWHCVQYNRQLWQNLLQQGRFNDYLSFVHGLVSVPNVQVFPAIQQLFDEGVIAPDAVVAPGHTAAFFSGDTSHSGQPSDNNWPELALQAVISRHYQNSRHALTDELITKVRQQIAEITVIARQQGIENSNSVAEAWNYRERQAKFIINSNRYYDFFALDWWMPFWDSEFMAFWQQVPYNLRRKKTLWTGFVEQAMSAYSGNPVPYGHASVKKYRWLTRCYSWFNYFLDDNHLYTLVPFNRWLLFKLRLSRTSGTVFGNLAMRCLRSYHNRFAVKSRN